MQTGQFSLVTSRVNRHWKGHGSCLAQLFMAPDRKVPSKQAAPAHNMFAAHHGSPLRMGRLRATDVQFIRRPQLGAHLLQCQVRRGLSQSCTHRHLCLRLQAPLSSLQPVAEVHKLLQLGLCSLVLLLPAQGRLLLSSLQAGHDPITAGEDDDIRLLFLTAACLIILSEHREATVADALQLGVR